MKILKESRYINSLFKSGIRKKMLILLLFASVIPVAITGLMLVSSAQQNMIEQTENYLKTTSSDKASYVNSYFIERKADILVLSKTPEVKKLLSEGYVGIESRDYLSKFMQSYGYLEILLISPDGEVIWGASADNSPIKVNTTSKVLALACKKAMDENETVISDYGLITEGYEPVLYIVSPVYASNTLLGVVALQINVNQINEVIRNNMSIKSGEETYLVDLDYSNGESDYYIIGENTKLKKIGALNYCTEAIEESIGLYENYRGIKVWGIHKSIQQVGWCLVVEIEEERISVASGGDKTALSFNTASIVLILMLSGVVYFSRSFISPINKLTQNIRDISMGRFDVEIDGVDRSDELGDLARAFDRTIVSLKLAMKQTAPELKKESDELKRYLKEKQVSEKKIKESELKFKTIFENVNDAIITLDTSGEITACNSKVLELFGYDTKELVGWNIKDLPHLFENKSFFTVIENFRKTVSGVNTEPYLAEGWRKNKDKLYLEISSSQLKLNNEIVGDLVILKDVGKYMSDKKKG